MMNKMTGTKIIKLVKNNLDLFYIDIVNFHCRSMYFSLGFVYIYGILSDHLNT